MKWIKASERLPLDIGRVRHVKIEHSPSMGNFYTGDNGKIYFGKNYGYERHIEEKDFHLIEWLDESEQLPSGVPSDDDIEDQYPVGGLKYPSNDEFPHPHVYKRKGAIEMRDRLAPMIAKLEEYKQKYGDL